MGNNLKTITQEKKVTFKGLKSFVLILALVFNSVAFGIGTVSAESENISDGIAANDIVKVPFLPQKFITATQDFSFDLFRESIDFEKNSLVSPTSVVLAMGMTSNGSDNNTKLQFQQLLAKNQFSVKQLNYYYNVMSSILQNNNNTTDSVYGNQLKLANSIWFKDSYDIYYNFLQTNADYYKADIFKSDFGSDTVTDINNWVNNKTGGLIDKIIDQIDENTMMFLINALLFEAEWQKQFAKEDASFASFKNLNGSYLNGIFFNSSKEAFLKSENATGFIKPYKGGKYSFVAMLPNEKTSIKDYVQTLNASSFQSFLNSSLDGKTADIGIPKFEYSFDVKLIDPFKRLGFVDAFFPSVADFSKMAPPPESIYIRDILHKTYIQLSEVGTKAGAVTKVEMADKAMPPVENKVLLNRPFVYAIVDNGTKLPIFIGTVINPFEKVAK